MSFGPFFVGERNDFSFPITDDVSGLPTDLTGYTAKVMLRQRGALTNKFITPANEDAVIPTPATNGVITYTMPTAWLAADVGEWIVQAQLTSPTAIVRKTEVVSFRVEAGLVPSV